MIRVGIILPCILMFSLEIHGLQVTNCVDKSSPNSVENLGG